MFFLQVRQVAEYYSEYKQCFEGAGTNPGEKTLEDKFFEEEVSVLNSDLVFYQNISGEAEQERLHAAVPLWRLLLFPQAEGAGVSQHHLDQRVRRPEPQSQD